MNAVFKAKPQAHGFAPGRSVVSNARVHLGRRLVLNLDLLDFFPSIHFGRVRGVFMARPFEFPVQVATMLAQLCCHRASLPQGAPTSPIISNLICRGLDRDLDRLARQHGCRYTRYADDITFSTNADRFPDALVAGAVVVPRVAPTLGTPLLGIVARHRFQINPRKTRARLRSERQEVTGVVVNTKLNVPRRYVREIRAALHHWATTDEATADARWRQLDAKSRKGGTAGLRLHLRGKLDYLKMVRGSGDPLHARYALQLAELAHWGPVELWGPAAANINLLSSALWIVIGRDASGDSVAQGTAFFLKDVGLVSARHVFEPDPTFAVATWEVRSAHRPDRVFPVTAIHQNDHIDIAVLETTAVAIGSLGTARTSVTNGDAVRVVGFPQWRTAADQLFVSRATVVQIKIASGLNYILTNAIVREGNSGGPLLDAHGAVAGVVVYGDSSPIAPNGALDITHVAHAQAGARRPL